MGNLTTTAIITKGLHCGPACKGIITSYFSLICKDAPLQKNSGGGPYPGNAWNKINSIQDFYKPVEQQPYIIPRDKEAEYFRKYKIVELKIKLGKNVVEKTYRVPEQKAKTIISIINLTNSTIDRIKVTINNLKRVITQISVKVKNLRKRR